MGGLFALGFAIAIVAGHATNASAICGDTVVDLGEQCDDGNVADGDCCSSTCQFEPGDYSVPCDHGLTGLCWSFTQGTCDGAGVCRPHASGGSNIPIGNRFTLRDGPGADADLIHMKLRHGRTSCFGAPPDGDPTIDTSFGLCLWTTVDVGEPAVRYLDELAYELVVPPGAGWEPTRKGWAYRFRDETGVLQVDSQSLARFKARGALAALPGPADATRYFASHVQYAIVNSAGFANFGSGEGQRNTPETFREGGTRSCD
jgi:cysteine-rich repeat protein